jgi:hypothetical protein
MRRAIVLSFLCACSGLKPGTDVQIVEKGGQNVYVAGAAAQGIAKPVACQAAVSRAVAAIAIKFAEEEDDIADEVADLVGASNGKVFLERYAKAAALDGALQDVSFDPMDHTCMASVSWTPPVFIKEAIQKYAERLKKEEMAEAEHPGAPAAAAEPAPAPSSGSGGSAVAAPAPAPAKPAPSPCASQLAAADKSSVKLQKASADFDECMRRSQDETICHRYKLYFDEAKAKDESASGALGTCKERHGL